MGCLQLLGTEEIFPVFTSDTQMLDQMWRPMCHFHEQSDRWDKAKFTLLALNTWSFAYKQSGKSLLWLSTQWPCGPWWTWWHVVPEGQHWQLSPCTRLKVLPSEQPLRQTASRSQPAARAGTGSGQRHAATSWGMATGFEQNKKRQRSPEVNIKTLCKLRHSENTHPWPLPLPRTLVAWST